MLELFGLMTAVDKFNNPPTPTYSNPVGSIENKGEHKGEHKLMKNEGFENFKSSLFKTYPVSWIIITLIIAFGTAYLAFTCNDKETPATRFVVTLFAFFFSGVYLIYYFIIYILLNKKCNGRDVSDLMKIFK